MSLQHQRSFMSTDQKGGTVKTAIVLCLLVLVALPLYSQTAIVVNHLCTNPDSIPPAYLDSVRARFRIGYGHTSHGSQLITGWEALRAFPGGKFTFTATSSGLNRGTFLNDYWPSPAGGADLGASGDLTWRNATRTMLNLATNDRNVVVWSWCGGVSSNTNAGIDAYLTAMDSLERQYPAVRFIYMTGHLDGSGTTGTLHLMNERIRQYCTSHGKLLFDFADIESYAPGSSQSVMALGADDNCDYDSDANGSRDKNWASTWVAAHPSTRLTTLATGCGSCAHSQQLNCVLKGTAFWWLLARMAGWSGSTAPTGVTTADLPQRTVLYQNYPNPFNPNSDIRYQISEFGTVRLAVYDLLGREVAVLVDENKAPGTYQVRFDGSALASGMYFCRMRSGAFTQTITLTLVR
jgi:hypothetical protein